MFSCEVFGGRLPPAPIVAGGQQVTGTGPDLPYTETLGITASVGSPPTLTTQYNEVTTTPAGGIVIVGTPTGGQPCFICNYGANILIIQPSSGNTFLPLGANETMMLNVGACIQLVGKNTTQWSVIA
jgi:hypothetical protein